MAEGRARARGTRPPASCWRGPRLEHGGSGCGGGMPARRGGGAGAVAPAQRGVLLLGGTGSGKSALLRRLEEFALRGCAGASDLEDIIPTIGVEVSEFRYRKTPVLIREVGGQMAALWPEYFKSCNMVIYAVDLGNRPQTSDAMVRLLDMLRHPDLLDKRVLVLLNKADCPRPMTRAEVDFSLGLSLLEASSARIASATVSAAKGHGLAKVLEWVGEG